MIQNRILFCGCFAILLLQAISLPAQDISVPPDSSRWILQGGAFVEHLERQAIVGQAVLKDVAFKNGVIEVDIAVNGERSYPGILFRMQSPENYEEFYIRPHRSQFYSDVLQYTPVFNGIAGWQLYAGPGFTATAEIPINEWLHLKLEVRDNQARIFLNNAPEPVLVIPELKHGISSGTIGVFGPKDKSAFFSNFKYRPDDALEFPAARPTETEPGIMTQWELSTALLASQVDDETAPTPAEIAQMPWQSVAAEASGLVDLARFVEPVGREPFCVYARASLTAETPTTRKMRFGYSDAVSIFLNGKIVFKANSSYQFRDPSFLGIIGYFDTIYLPLEAGENQLLLLISEGFGGGGFMCQDGDAIYLHPELEAGWETPAVFKIPETAVFYKNVFYISNFDGYNPGRNGDQFISQVTADGEITALNWLTGLNNPVGMTVVKNTLFVLELRSLVEVDLAGAKIIQRYPVPGAVFLNDIATDEKGNFWFSDSRTNVIYHFAKGQISEWFRDPRILRPNGIHYLKGELFVACNGDQSIKAINIKTNGVRTVAQFGAGILDGIETDQHGNLLVSQVEGKLYRISPSGEITKLLDTSVPLHLMANFKYIPEKNLLVIPTFLNNKVVTYRFK